MDRLEEFKKNKQYILEDILGSITPGNDCETDICRFMRSYLEDELDVADKAGLLEELVMCITGQPYHYPKACAPFFSQTDNDELGKIMDRFIDGLVEGCAEGHLPPAKALADKMWSEIHTLDDKTGNHLLDSWRQDEIYKWVLKACEASIQEALEIKNNLGGIQMI